MNEDSRTDWKRVLNMTDAEVTANALKDPDSLPLPPTGGTKEIHLSEEDGATLLERFRKARRNLERPTPRPRSQGRVFRYWHHFF